MRRASVWAVVSNNGVEPLSKDDLFLTRLEAANARRRYWYRGKARIVRLVEQRGRGRRK